MGKRSEKKGGVKGGVEMWEKGRGRKGGGGGRVEGRGGGKGEKR